MTPMIVLPLSYFIRWRRSTVVERWSLIGELSLSCAGLQAGRMITFGSDVRYWSANMANSAIHPLGVGK